MWEPGAEANNPWAESPWGRLTQIKRLLFEEGEQVKRHNVSPA